MAFQYQYQYVNVVLETQICAEGRPGLCAHRLAETHRTRSGTIKLTRRKWRPSGQQKCLISKDVLISETGDLLIGSSNLLIKQ